MLSVNLVPKIIRQNQNLFISSGNTIHDGGLLWLRSNDRSLLRFAIIGILLLTIIHVYLSISLFDVHTGIFEFLHIITILILIVMFISILLKGIVPVAISCLGIVLIYGSIVIPFFFSSSLGPFYYKASIGYLNFEAINRVMHMLFSSWRCHGYSWDDSRIQAHILYTRNRPISTDQLGQSIQSGMKNYSSQHKDRILDWAAKSVERHREISTLEIRIHTRFDLWHSISGSNLFIRP